MLSKGNDIYQTIYSITLEYLLYIQLSHVLLQHSAVWSYSSIPPVEMSSLLSKFDPLILFREHHIAKRNTIFKKIQATLSIIL